MVLEICDSDNETGDVYVNDFFDEANEEYKSATAESTVEVPRLNNQGPRYPPEFCDPP
ncbi:MAG: hypothetical protein P4M11_08665 [Candidatus Pacebacteria bacterium]|nr:hypothetical protein [Candidatus Paceibacterota bacterium]